ncbi:MAG: hypothetical protein JNL41_05455 [Phenylobacterium sp.]|uniref:hypothetical protein n=1 Tax=Phenylobacterium sp. TaxID=1871053 RepID=UPI001A366BB0|nr:hypothetical protein [Phenylobacterium sp.]MBL8553703.1 hypothetical protein [Phenylobacterium sp.]
MNGNDKHTAPRGQGPYEVYGEPLDLEAATAAGLWGARFAAVAMRAGIEMAASLPLPAREEAEARRMAGSLTINRDALPQPFATFPTVAEHAYRTAEALARKARQTPAPSPDLLREADDAVQRAENLGRLTALMARVTFLSVRAQRDLRKTSR